MRCSIPIVETKDTSCGLYVHIPFCETKCGYCDFYSVPMKGRKTGPLVEQVIRELRFRTDTFPRPIQTIFCGGGTPTLLPIDELGLLLKTLDEVTKPEIVEEFTVEANPATVEVEKAALLAKHRVTRVSMGAQSFFPGELEALERLHTPSDIAPSVEVLRRFGIQQINIDLIFGIPGQTRERWNESLQRAIDLGVEHVACYGLTYEPGTKLTAQLEHGSVIPCDEGLEAELYLHAIEKLTQAGYEQYEISNFAKPGYVCRHNLKYWRNEPYIGVGPSSAGCFDGRRYKNVADISGYVRDMKLRGSAESEVETIIPETAALEMILMQLRLNEGLNLQRLQSMIDGPIRANMQTELTRLTQCGLLSLTPTRAALTSDGRLVANRVMADLAGALSLSV